MWNARTTGIMPWQDGGGAEATLIETRDQEGALNAAEIARIIDQVILSS